MQAVPDEMLKMFIFSLKYHLCPVLEIGDIPGLERLLLWISATLDVVDNVEDTRLVTECKRMIKLHESVILSCSTICDFHSALNEAVVLPKKRRAKIEVITV